MRKLDLDFNPQFRYVARSERNGSTTKDELLYSIACDRVIKMVEDLAYERDRVLGIWDIVDEGHNSVGNVEHYIMQAAMAIVNIADIA